MACTLVEINPAAIIDAGFGEFALLPASCFAPAAHFRATRCDRADRFGVGRLIFTSIVAVGPWLDNRHHRVETVSPPVYSAAVPSRPAILPAGIPTQGSARGAPATRRAGP